MGAIYDPLSVMRLLRESARTTVTIVTASVTYLPEDGCHDFAETQAQSTGSAHIAPDCIISPLQLSLVISVSEDRRHAQNLVALAILSPACHAEHDCAFLDSADD